jgi:UDP-N-acetylmuramoyl-tripeptide--D-alanyl-D-alanine ligase
MLTLNDIALLLEQSGKIALPENLAGKQALFYSQDSRAITPGSIFVCTRGENVDGHDFVPEAIKKGALAVIAERDPFAGLSGELSVPLFRVENSLKAITILAAAWRERAGRRGTKVIGITGTAGKTSLKEALAAVLSKHARTAKNFMNMNNQWGLPLSILNAPDDAVYWVLEAGISNANDMDELAGLLRPELAIILNVGAGHLSGLGDKGVAYYKSRMLAYLPEGGQALINGDYPELVRESAVYPVKQQFFSGKDTNADVFAAYSGPVSAVSGAYSVRLRNSEAFNLTAPFRGAFGAENVAAIVGAGIILGLDRKEIINGLSDVILPQQRFNCQVFENTLLIDDSYNANPLSAMRMLESAAEMASEKKLPLLLVMGEMLELGAETAAEHVELGKNMATTKAKAVLWKGGNVQSIAQGLEQGGFRGEFKTAQSSEEFKDIMSGQYKKYGSCGVVLFKGSRANRLERYVEIFKKEFCPNNKQG